jgi:hypothetical protein
MRSPSLCEQALRRFYAGSSTDTPARYSLFFGRGNCSIKMRKQAVWLEHWCCVWVRRFAAALQCAATAGLKRRKSHPLCHPLSHTASLSLRAHIGKLRSRLTDIPEEGSKSAPASLMRTCAAAYSAKKTSWSSANLVT